MMPKRIDMPGHIGHVIEGVLHPSQSDCHLVDEILVVHVSLVGHAPPSVDEGKLFIRYKGLHTALFFFCGLVPPSVKEGHLDDRELVFWMVSEFLNNGVDGVLDSCKLNSHISTIVVVVDSFKPADIVVRMGDEMDGEGRSILRIFFVMMLLHHFLVVISQGSEACGNQATDDKKPQERGVSHRLQQNKIRFCIKGSYNTAHSNSPRVDTSWLCVPTQQFEFQSYEITFLIFP